MLVGQLEQFPSTTKLILGGFRCSRHTIRKPLKINEVVFTSSYLPVQTNGKRMRAKGEFHTIDPSFFLTKSRQREPQSSETGHRGNGKPTSFTDLTREDLTLEPRRAAMLRRSNFLPYDGVLYEIDDAPDEEDALWSHNGRHHLTYWDYLRIIREEERAKLQSIVVKQLETKSVDYSKSP